MMFGSARNLWLIWLSVLLLVTPALCAAQASAASEAASAGWEALWTNDFTKAEHFFQAALVAADDDQSARRGLVLAALARGEDDLVQEQLKSYGDRIPSGPFDFFLPQAVQQFSDLDSKDFYRMLFDYAENLARGKELPPVDRRVYESLASHYAYLAGDAGAVKRIAKRLNRIGDWCVLGPFDNTSGCGHRKDHADTKYVLSAPYVGKFGQHINWLTPDLIGLDRSITPTHYFHKQYNTTAYIRTAVEFKDAGTYLISVGHVGAMEFRINDVVVHEGSRLAGGEEILHWHVDLPAEHNLLSFKLSNRWGDGSVSCAISRTDGSAVRGVAFEPGRQVSHPPGADLNVTPVRADFLKEIEELQVSNPGDTEAQFWNLFRIQSYAEPDSAVVLCDSLAERFPDSALMQMAIAEAYGGAGEEDRRKQLSEGAAELAPDLAPAVLFVAAQNLEKKRYATARTAAEAVLMRAPTCRAAIAVRLNCLLNEQKLEELKSAAELVTESLDDDPLGYSYLAEHAGVLGISAEEKRYTRKMIKRMPTHSAIVAKYLESAEEQEYAEMEKELRRFMDLVPDSAYLRVSYVQILLARDKLDRAWDVITESLRSFPQSIPLIRHRSLFVEGGYDFDQSAVPALFPDGKRTLTIDELRVMFPDEKIPTRVITLQDVDETQLWFRAYSGLRAADILEDALAIDPGSFEIRDKIRSLRGKPSYRTLMPDPDIRAILETRVDPDAYEGEDAVVLVERKRRLAFDEHASIRDYCVAIQVLNEEGIRRWENYGLSVSPYANDIVVLEKKTIKPDGTEHEAESSPSGVLFTNVEPGDVLFLHHQMTTHVTGALSGNFWDSHLFSFSNPCLESKYVLIAPLDSDIPFRMHNEADFAESIDHRTERLKDGFELQEWCFRNPPKIDWEPGAVPARSYVPWIDVTTIESWETVAEWYADLADGQAELTRKVRQKAAELVDGAESDEDKIRNVLRFVADDITYQFIPFFQSAHVPREADEVLTDRLGDCKDKCTLMIALLEAVGVSDCDLALVTPGSDAGIAYLPSPRFSHVVVHRLLPDGTSRWYDPTVRFPDPDQIPRALAGVPALVARSGEEDMSVIPTPGLCEHPRRMNSQFELSANGDARVSRRSSYSSINATSSMRTHLMSVSQQDIEDEVLTGLAVNCPGAELVSLEVSGIDEPDSSLVYDYLFEAPSLLAPTGGIISGSLPTGSQLTKVFGAIVAKKERSSPIDLRALGMCESSRTSVEYPPGFGIVAVPEDREYRFDDCLYSTRYKAVGNSLWIERETVIAGDRVEPGRYNEFKAFLDGILQDMRTPMLFQKR